eukprot:66669-Pelagomonas_calceolata.AAC.5
MVGVVMVGKSISSDVGKLSTSERLELLSSALPACLLESRTFLTSLQAMEGHHVCIQLPASGQTAHLNNYSFPYLLAGHGRAPYACSCLPQGTPPTLQVLMSYFSFGFAWLLPPLTSAEQKAELWCHDTCALTVNVILAWQRQVDWVCPGIMCPRPNPCVDPSHASGALCSTLQRPYQPHDISCIGGGDAKSKGGGNTHEHERKSRHPLESS